MAGMKTIAPILMAMLLAPLAVRAQTLPNAPVPAPAPAPAPPLSDAEWQRIEQLNSGQTISIHVLNGFPLECRFAVATEEYLFCDAMDAPAGASGYRIDRANVLSVRVVRPERDWHPVLLTFIAAGGVLTGLGASRTLDDGRAAAIGVLGALVTAGIGMSMPPPPGPFAANGYATAGMQMRLGLRPPRRWRHFFIRRMR